MNQHRLETVTHRFRGHPSRRRLLRGLAGAGLAWGAAQLPHWVEAKNQRKKKGKKGLCTRDGSPCTRFGKKCQKKFCLNAPFTIELTWAHEADHEAYLFLPPENATTGPSPQIYPFCQERNSRCEDEYPFACVNDDVYTTGTEVTTIYRRLPGPYEYWVELKGIRSAGEVTVILKDTTGRIVRRWANPAKSLPNEAGWHVFNVDGRDGRVTSIDVLLAPKGGLPEDAHDPYTSVCPDNA